MNIVKKLINRKFTELFAAEKTCCTRKMGNQMFECKVRKPNPMYCEYSLSMGEGYICKHPDRQDFAA